MAVNKITVPAARKNAHLTQAELAKLCNVSISTVGNWERYRTEPTVSQAKAIAKAVGLELDDLIFLPSQYGKTVQKQAH